MMHDQTLRANHLATETSPYLLLHAHNPVDWYPWGPAAFAAAKALDKPILLSIGYSTCYWCHVMERESFADPHTARVLNEAFICVKVDREERPDLDEQYMQAVQLLTGSGGWPMTVMLTPDLKPFFGGTYYPPDQLRRIAGALSDLWRGERARVLTSAQEITDAMARGQRWAVREGGGLGPHELAAALDQLLSEQDDVHGGHRGAPKFPQDMTDRLLLSAWRRGGRPELLVAARRSLDNMALGGIHDHVGGGFHRYSTDGMWTVPHFEKMLYNQAGLLRAYAEAAALTGSWWYREVCEGIVTFVTRELLDAETGAFWTALDAETDGEEGRFYLWTRAEWDAALGPDADACARRYGLADGPNFHDPRGGPTDLSVPRLATPPEQPGRLPALDTLLAQRDRRPRPLTDDKLLCAWNGLMIGAMAKAGALLDQPAWVAAAARAADWALAHLRDDANGLLHVWRLGRAKQAAFLDDYAALAIGLLDLCEATGDGRWLDSARALANSMVQRFAAEDGGFFGSPGEADDLLARAKPVFDNALPSGNSLAAELLFRLADLGEEALRALAQATVSALAPLAERHPYGLANLLRVAHEHGAEDDSARYVSVSARRIDEGCVHIEFLCTPGRHLADLGCEQAEIELCAPLSDQRRATARLHLPASGQPTTIALRVQTCGARVCQRPARLHLSLD